MCSLNLIDAKGFKSFWTNLVFVEFSFKLVKMVPFALDGRGFVVVVISRTKKACLLEICAVAVSFPPSSDLCR